LFSDKGKGLVSSPASPKGKKGVPLIKEKPLKKKHTFSTHQMLEGQSGKGKLRKVYSMGGVRRAARKKDNGAKTDFVDLADRGVTLEVRGGLALAVRRSLSGLSNFCKEGE